MAYPDLTTNHTAKPALTGRFAPSPTGPLHMGSLITALASFCDMKQRGGQWSVRIDDIDPLRSDANALAQIQRSLKAHGLLGDGPVRLQSQRTPDYARARDQLNASTYYCDCSRSKLKSTRLYPGYCRDKRSAAPDHAVRLRVDDQLREFSDEIKGILQFDPRAEFGDFVIWRRDDVVTYHLATAVDDGEHYSHVLRGEDLYEQTLPQLVLIERLGLAAPSYAHIPVLAYADGTKLSKQTHAPALDDAAAANNLRAAFDFLGQNPPTISQSVDAWLQWGVKHWRLAAIPHRLQPFQHNPIPGA